MASKKKKKKKNSTNIPSLVITIIAAILAIGAVVFLVVTMKSDEEPDIPDIVVNTTPPFQATQELVDETQQAAYDLLPENYKVYQYLTRGMTHEEEPYGNIPEDGFYTCVSDDFKSFDDFSEYVRSIYTEETAEKLLNNPFGNGPVYGVDDTGALGLSFEFTPDPDSGLSWANVSFLCTPVSDTECDVKVTLQDADGKDVDKNVKMVLQQGEWKLSEMIG
ncbi:MAG: hypothetical protein HDT47_05670 [Ruminococcaceae bacterium]|nr:hypothetical protein [Oscillospiraceae bacterium]